jgi:hypothetical protein
MIASARRVRSVNLNVSINGKNILATPTGLKLGSSGRVTPPAELFAVLPKSDRRKIRKAARANGMIYIAKS